MLKFEVSHELYHHSPLWVLHVLAVAEGRRRNRVDGGAALVARVVVNGGGTGVAGLP